MADLDFANLLEEFNLPEPTEDEIKKVKKDVKTETPAINMEVKNVDPEDPDHIIARNIAKADAILDKLMHEMDDGNFSPRMVEVSGQIINAITNSTSLLYNKNFNLANIQLKIQQIKLKEKEIDLLAGKALGGDTTNQNIIFTDRESVLKFLRGEKKESMKFIDVKKEEMEENNG